MTAHYITVVTPSSPAAQPPRAQHALTAAEAASSPAHLAAVLTAIETAAAANTAAYRAAGRLEPVNRFSSRIVPALTLPRLGELMLRGTDCDDSLAMAAAVLVVRFCATSGTPLTSKMMHRLFIAALHVAIKTHSDSYLANAVFAQIAGITSLELNLLELALAEGLHWHCLVEARHVAPVVANPAAYVSQRIPGVWDDRTASCHDDRAGTASPVVLASGSHSSSHSSLNDDLPSADSPEYYYYDAHPANASC